MKAKPAATAETWAVFSPHCDQKSPHHGGKIIAGFFFFSSVNWNPILMKVLSGAKQFLPRVTLSWIPHPSVWGLSLVLSSD